LNGSRHAGYQPQAFLHVIDVDAHRHALGQTPHVNIGFTDASPAGSGSTLGTLIPWANVDATCGMTRSFSPFEDKYPFADFVPALRFSAAPLAPAYRYRPTPG
jgi:hypothetical protein